MAETDHDLGLEPEERKEQFDKDLEEWENSSGSHVVETTGPELLAAIEAWNELAEQTEGVSTFSSDVPGPGAIGEWAPLHNDKIRAGLQKTGKEMGPGQLEDPLYEEDFERLKKLREAIIAVAPDVLSKMDANFKIQQDYRDWLDAKADADIGGSVRVPGGELVKGQRADVGGLQKKKDADQAKLRTEADVPVTVAAGGAELAPPFFKEQCFLLAQIPYFVTYKREVLEKQLNEKRLPYTNVTKDNQKDDAPTPWENASDTNACLQMGGSPFGFINRLTQYPSYLHLLNMKTSEIANLQPLIKLFKITMEEDKEDPGKIVESQLEIPFDSYFTKQDLKVFEKKDIRGVGVGIQDFTFSYEGHDPFAVKKSIKAKLTIFANNFSELLRDRNGFKYIDLALKTGTTKSLSLETFNRSSGPNVRKSVADDPKLNFRLKAVVGWAYRSDWGTAKAAGSTTTSTLSNKVKTALYNSFVTLSLTPTIHDFDIDDQGRVKFVINYLAYVEDYFDQPNFNIFPNANVKVTGTEKYIEAARAIRDIKGEIWAAKCESENVQKLKKGLEKEIQTYRRESLQALMKKMFEYGKIRYLKVSSAEIYKFRQDGVQYDPSALFSKTDGPAGSVGGIQSMDTYQGDIETEIASIIEGNVKVDEEEKNKRLLSVASAPSATGTQEVTFFYVSDLIDVILEGLCTKYGKSGNSITSQLKGLRATGVIPASGENDEVPKINLDKEAKEVVDAHIRRTEEMAIQLKKLRVVLGPLELVNQKNYSVGFPSLGDLPISVKYFVEWLSKKMSDREDVYYPLPKFLNDLFNNLIRDFLNSSSCFSNQAKQKTTINQASIVGYKETPDSPDEITTDLIKYRIRFPRSGRISIDWYGIGDSDFPLPVIDVAASRDNPISDGGIKNQVEYLVYHAGRAQPAELMKGEPGPDAEKGIFHYAIGRDRGITKTIKLKKTDSTGLKELRFEQDGYDGLQQLREVFDVDISTYANVTAYPGCYIYVDPEGFAPGYVGMGAASVPDLTQIGIGGYHMIIRSEHSFGPGRANSRIHAKWVASTDAKVTANLVNKDKKTDDPKQDVYCFPKEVDSKSEGGMFGSGAGAWIPIVGSNWPTGMLLDKIGDTGTGEEEP